MGMTRNILVCGLVVGFFIVGCGQDQEPPKYAGEGDAEIEKGSKMTQQDEAEARAEARAKARARAEAELEARVAAEIEAEARAEARVEAEVEASVEAKVEPEPEPEVESKARAEAVVRAETRAMAEGGSRSREGKRSFIIIDRAYTLLDQGKYTEAISSAQNVLDNYDNNSQEARSIIAKAKEKLQATAEAKAE